MTSPASSRRPDPAGVHLVLCAAEETLHVVLGRNAAEGPEVLFARAEPTGRRTMALIGPLISQGISAAGISAAQLAGAACATGPGSFTGLRITLSLASGLLAGADIPLAGLPYLPLLARSAEAPERGTLLVVTYARRRLVYVQPFARPSCEPLAEAIVMAAADLPEWTASLPGPVFALGTGLRANPEVFEPTAGNLSLLGKEQDIPSSDALLEAALTANYASSAPSPLYLRPSDAEDNLDAVARARGTDPEAARRDLLRLTGRDAD